jgi:glycosyltransferase involved in cell wall biosynthesis
VVGGTVLNPDGTLRAAGSVVSWEGRISAVADDGSASELSTFERRVDYCSAGFMLIRRSAWKDVGGFDERFYPAHYEDADLCLRLQQRGQETWYQPLAAVVGGSGASTTANVRAEAREANRQRFANRWRATLREREAVGTVEEAVWQAMGRPLRVLVIDDRIPSYQLGSGFGRMLDVLSALSDDTSLSVTFHPIHSDRIVEAGLSRMGVRTVWELERHLETPGVDYDVVVISRPHNGSHFVDVVDRYLPHAPIIFDAEALYFRRLALQADLATTEPERERLLAESRSMRDVEREVLDRVDHVVCISEDEASIASELSATPVSVVSPLLSAPRTTDASFAARAHVGFVAGWLAGPGGPNSDALLWYAKEVMPRVLARLPWCRLLVTGAAPPDDVRWVDGPAISFLGEVQDLAAFYDSVRLVVSPTRFGAGVKLKTVEAIQYGVPVVATSEGAAGLDERLRRSVAVHDDAAAFADAVISLASDRGAWERARALLLENQTTSADLAAGVRAWPDLVLSIARTERKVTT